MLDSLMIVPRGTVLLSLVSGYWEGALQARVWFAGKAAFYFTYPAGLIRVQLNQNDLFKITKGFGDSTGVKKLDWEN